MKKMRVLLLLCFATVCMSATDCEQHKGNLPQYTDAAGKVFTIGKDGIKKYRTADEGVAKALQIIETVRQVNGVAGVTVPGAQVPSLIIEGVLGGISLLLGTFYLKKSKEVKVEKRKIQNMNEAIEAGIADGNDKTIISVAVLKEVLDTDTKADFNAGGLQTL